MATTSIQKVSVIDPDRLLNERAVAKRLGCTAKALQKWRVTGEGPVFIKVGSLVRYDLQSVLAWIETRRRSSTSTPRPAA